MSPATMYGHLLSIRFDPAPVYDTTHRAMRAVALVIAQRADWTDWSIGRGREAWDRLTVDDIADAAGYSRRHVRRTLRALEASGVLTVLQRSGRPAVYQLKPGAIHRLAFKLPKLAVAS